MLRLLTAGESHGKALVMILDGIPSGLALDVSDIQKDLDRRKGGDGRGGRGLIEDDQAQIISGIRFGKTIGSPITILLRNKDYNNWKTKKENDIKVLTPRPGHADLAGVQKYGLTDVRSVLERASARETAMRVAAGAVCRKLLLEFNIKIASHTTKIGNAKLEPSQRQYPWSYEQLSSVYSKDPSIRCLSPEISQKMAEEITKALKNKDTLGGIVEVVGYGVMPGLGSYVQYDRKLDGRIAQQLMSIQSVKAVEIGEAVDNSGKLGSLVQDEIYKSSLDWTRKTNRAGGIEGGMSNGENIVVKIYLKPLATLGKPLRTVNIQSKKPSVALVERSDICVVPRASSVAEAAMAFVICEAILEKFGQDCLSDIKLNIQNYLSRL